MDNPIELEARAEEYARDGDPQAAVKCFYDLVVHYARARDFARAEAMRERLMAIDDMALTEIIKSAEIIEAEKSGAIDADHLQTFKALYDTLTEEETNALYFACRPLTLEAGEVLFRQGDANTRLFFILSGQLKLYFSREGKDNLIALLEQGDIAGQDAFFATSTCTTSLAVQSHADLQVLEREPVAAWRQSHPALEAKLTEFCRTRDIGKLVMAKGLERRRSRRIKVEGPASAQILDAADRPLGKPFRGDMADVSNTGLSFYIKATDKSARLLLGRRLKLTATLEAGGKRQRLERTGIVVAVNPLFFGDFSIHLKFEQPLKSS
jgi:CRP-like cAMP-binding protein